MGKLIDRLWETEIEFTDFQTNEMKELLKIANGTAKELEQNLDEKQKEFFNEYCKYLGEYHDLMEKRIFSNGFSLGAQLALEVFEESEKQQ